MSNWFNVKGKNVVIIGGAGGLGQSNALAYAEEGANVVIASRNEESLKRAQAEIKAACGKEVKYFVADASVEADVIKLVEDCVAALGKVDVLICTQAMNKKFNAEDFPLDIFEQMLKVNVLSLMSCCKYFGKHMMENKYGKIILYSSTRGKVATKAPGNAGYCSTKGAVDMLTRQLASEFGPHGITVNAIGPTNTETPMTVEIFEQRGGDAYRATLANDHPMRRVATPDDCSGVALFLGSPASDYVTGNIIYPDGGLTCNR